MSIGGRRTALIVGVLAIVLAATLVNIWANSPATTSSTVAITQAAPTPSSPLPHELNTDYFTTQLPSNIIVRTRSDVVHGNILEQLMASNGSGHVADQLGITIGSLATQPLSDLSSVRLRLGDTKTYKRITIPQMPAQAIAFEQIDGLFEKSVFWPSGKGRYAAVVVSGTVDRAGYLNAFLGSVVSNWVWK